MKRVSLKGIVLAALLVFVLDTVAGVVMVFVMGSGAFSKEMTDQQLNAAITAVTMSSNFLLGSLIFGTLSTIAGGYVAARIARREPYLNAGILGGLGILMGILLAGNYPAWFNVLGFLLVLPAALLGGHLARPRSVA